VSIGVLAVSGDPAPGTDRAFYEFQTPSLNASGDVAFQAYLEEDGGLGEWTVYLASGGDLQLVARGGELAPGTPAGVRFLAGALPAIDDAGVVTFHAWLQPGGGVTAANDEGFWAYDPATGELSLLVREGAPAPGGVAFSSFSAGHAQSAAGHVGFYPNDGSAIWMREPDGSLGLVAAAGEAAPGALDGALFGRIEFPFLDGIGSAAFEAQLAPSLDRALFAPDGAGGVTLAARGGAQAPGAPPGALFDVFLLGDVNEAGEICFFAVLQEGPGGVTSADQRAIWGPDGSGGPMLLARAGGPAPGVPGAVFSGVGEEVFLDAAGRITFRAALEHDPGVVGFGDDTGVWRSDGAGGLALLLREGDLLPDGSSTYRGLSPAAVVVAGAGDVALQSEIEGPGFGPGQGVVLVDAAGQPAVVLRSGSVVEVAPGDARSVGWFDPVSGVAQAAGYRALNDARQLALVARFDDQSRAVVVATVPEPGRALLLLVGAAILFARGSLSAPPRPRS
jgi:hypothetical protein